MLKTRLLGDNPCHVDQVFRKIKQSGGHARQGGGVCAVEMAAWDLAGKAFGVPVYQVLGGKFRDRVRLYADTNEVADGRQQGLRLKERMDAGLTWLKVDVGVDLVATVAAPEPDEDDQGRGGGPRSHRMGQGTLLGPALELIRTSRTRRS